MKVVDHFDIHLGYYTRPTYPLTDKGEVCGAHLPTLYTCMYMYVTVQYILENETNTQVKRCVVCRGEVVVCSV